MFHQVRIPDDLYKRISIHAADEERTTNAQIVRSLRALFPEPIAPAPTKSPYVVETHYADGVPKDKIALARERAEMERRAEGITKSGAMALRRE